MVNPVGSIHQQGCRPGVTDREGAEGLCTPAVGFVGPLHSNPHPHPHPTPTPTPTPNANPAPTPNQVGPLRAADGPLPVGCVGCSDQLLAQFGVRPRIVRTELDDP